MTSEEKIKRLLLNALMKSQGINKAEVDEIGLELTRNSSNEHGDFSSNIALKLAGKLKRSPLMIAEEIIDRIEPSEDLDRAEFAKPGFINLYLSAEKKHGILRSIFSQGKNFGSSCAKEKRKYYWNLYLQIQLDLFMLGMVVMQPLATLLQGF